MKPLPDDIEHFLKVGKRSRAIEALARLRSITLDQARGLVIARLSNLEFGSGSKLRGWSVLAIAAQLGK